MGKRICTWLVGLAIVGGSLQAARAQAAPLLLETDASRAMVEEGRRALFAFRLDAAEARFREVLSRPDGRPAGYHYLAAVALYKGLVTDDKVHFETFMARADSLREVLDARPETVWSRQMLAKSALMRTVAAGKLQRYLRAAWAARSAYNAFEALTDEHPDFSEAQLGMGLLHLTVAALPAGWRDFLSVLGFEGTAPQALRELRHAARHSHYNREEAQLALVLADIVLLQEVERGTARMETLYEEDPESLLYKHLYGFALFTHREAKRAESILRSAIERDNSRYFYIEYLEYYLAEALFVQDRFVEAATYYRRYLEQHDGLSLRAMSRYRLGVALEMQGQRAEAEAVYQSVEADRDFDSDYFARRWANKRLRAPMDSLDRQGLRGENAFLSGRYARAERLLRAVFESDEASPPQRTHAAYYIGQTLHVQERYSEAYPAYSYAVQHPGDPKAEWAAWSQLFIAEMYVEQGKKAAAIKAYEKALQLETPYDYYQSLEQTARIALEQLRHRAEE